MKIYGDELIGLETAGKKTFDSVIVVTDRRVLDKQIRDTIKQFAQVSSIVGHAEKSGDLRAFLKAGKKIIKWKGMSEMDHAAALTLRRSITVTFVSPSPLRMSRSWLRNVFSCRSSKSAA